MGVVVVGVNRGGTSSVAASLNSLGIFLGDHWHEPVYEDVHLARYFRKRKWRSFRTQVEKYEGEHDLFGWKLPDSRSKLRKINKIFKKPKYIFIFRDVFAIAHRKNNALGSPVLSSMFMSSLAYLKILFFVQVVKPSCLFLSYEKILTDTEGFSSELLSFLELEMSEENIKSIKEAISNSSYRKWVEKSSKSRLLKHSGYEGHLDHLDEKKVAGWVRSLTTDQPVNLEVFVNEVKVGGVTAGQYREDLVVSAVSDTGCHGFSFVFESPIGLNDAVSVKPASTGMDLIGSPRNISHHHT